VADGCRAPRAALAEPRGRPVTGRDDVLTVSLDVSAVPDRPAGAGRYIVNLAGQLGRRPDLALLLVSRSADARRWAAIAPRASVLAAAPGRRPLRLVWEQARLPRVLENHVPRPQVHHGPHYTMPERSRLPKVVTVHDLTFFDHPEWHERAKVALFRRAIRTAVARADAVICVSEATAERVHALIDPRAEVSVIPHGVDSSRFRPDGADDVSEADDLAVLARRGVRPPYVAFLGTIEPRKGLDVLLRAFERVAPRHPDLRLVVAGATGWGTGPVRAATDGMRHADRVVRLGYLDDDVVPALLRRATVVAYPSRAEGFGLPVLEALACAAPVVTSAGTAMQDWAEGATLVPPGDDRALADAIDAIVGGEGPGPEARREVAAAVAARHTWEASAEQHVDIYRRVSRH